MRAAVLTRPGGDLEIEELELPPLSAAEVLVDVSACGICGTDLHISRSVAAPGAILGHEIAGQVAEVGGDVTGWAVGTPVAVRPFAGCGTCDWCVPGRADHCQQFQLLGLARPGGFAEQVAVPATQLFRLPATLSGPEQALVEPAAVALHALRRVNLQAGQDVLVLGGGPVGLTVCAWARALGARRVIVSDPVAPRRELALALGADGVIDPSTGSPEEALANLANGAPQVVMECTGVPGVIGQGLALAGVGARIGVVGICLGSDSIWPYAGIQKELDLRFCIYYDSIDFTDTITALDEQTLKIESLITETVRLDALPRRFAELVENPGSGKVVISA